MSITQAANSEYLHRASEAESDTASLAQTHRSKILQFCMKKEQVEETESNMHLWM